MKMSWMSRSRACRPSIRYSLSPLRNSRRVMVTSLGLGGQHRNIRFRFRRLRFRAIRRAVCPGSISTMVTDAMPTAFRFRVPAKITSSMRAPRKLRADCSPSTQVIASLRFDLPQPFGPDHGGDAACR